MQLSLCHLSYTNAGTTTAGFGGGTAPAAFGAGGFGAGASAGGFGAGATAGAGFGFGGARHL